MLLYLNTVLQLKCKLQRIKDQGTEFEFTEVQMFNQGMPGNRGNYCRGYFLLLFASPDERSGTGVSKKVNKYEQ